MENITYVYLIRHAEQLKEDGIKNINEDTQISNEKIPLSAKGEKQAENVSNIKELNNIYTLWSSNYVRAISTAKYIALNNKIDINIDEKLGERKLGNLEKLRILGRNKKYSYTIEQLLDENLKNTGGESRKEVTKRMLEAFLEVVNNNRGKKIAIFTHDSSMTFLLMRWCKLEYIKEDKHKCLSFNNKIIIDRKYDAPEIFKLLVDDKNNVVDVKNIVLEAN